MTTDDLNGIFRAEKKNTLLNRDHLHGTPVAQGGCGCWITFVIIAQPVLIRPIHGPLPVETAQDQNSRYILYYRSVQRWFISSRGEGGLVNRPHNSCMYRIFFFDGSADH